MNDDILSQKKLLRRHILERRDALPHALREQKSIIIANIAERFLPHSQNDTIAGFLPIRSEINLIPLMRIFENKNIPLCVPAINNDRLDFRKWTHDDVMVDMEFGTYGPNDTSALLTPSIVLLPLIAFDKNGNRLGYGRGFYDRTITHLHNHGITPLLIGVGFDCQKVAHVPHEPHDVPLDTILTESGLFSFQK